MQALYTMRRDVVSGIPTQTVTLIYNNFNLVSLLYVSIVTSRYSLVHARRLCAINVSISGHVIEDISIKTFKIILQTREDSTACTYLIGDFDSSPLDCRCTDHCAA